MRRKARLFVVFIIMLCLVVSAAQGVSAAGGDFSDVPKGHWAYECVNELRSLGVTDGIGNNIYGLGRTITRAEFTAFLCKLMNFGSAAKNEASFTDVKPSDWYYSYVQAAISQGIVDTTSSLFRPAAAITREEMAVMIVRSLGYGAMGEQLSYLPKPFPDVQSSKGYISMAKDFGIISGLSADSFAPGQTATREQAAVMMIRMYRLLNNRPGFINGFYAISSAKQMGAFSSLDAVSFGWSRLEAGVNGVTLNTAAAGSNEYNFPAGFEAPYNAASGKTRMLMVAVKDTDASAIISDAQKRRAAVGVIADAANHGIAQNGSFVVFDGVVLDFETLKGAQSKNNYNEFLAALKESLVATGKLIYVAVHPSMSLGRDSYDGYDYKTIGAIADKVILMAHDYNPKALSTDEMDRGIVMTPLAPIEDVYYALSAVTDAKTGVTDKSKIVLQLNFASAQWKLQGGKVINSKPFLPGYDAIVSRIKTGAEMKYSIKHESPYITFRNESDNTDNVVWYENTRSVEAKIKLSGMFGIGGISLWRLGIVPDYESGTGLDVLRYISEIN